MDRMGYRLDDKLAGTRGLGDMPEHNMQAPAEHSHSLLYNVVHRDGRNMGMRWQCQEP
jgi:hypothetical protein